MENSVKHPAIISHIISFIPRISAILDRVILTHEDDSFTLRHLLRTAVGLALGLLFCAVTLCLLS